MKFIQKSLLHCISLMFLAKCAAYDIDFSLDIIAGGTLTLDLQDSYSINAVINANTDSDIIATKPVKINSANGMLNIKNSSCVFKDTLTIDNYFSVDGDNWSCDVYKELILSGNISLLNKGNYDGKINILSKGMEDAVFDVSLLKEINTWDYNALNIDGNDVTYLKYITSDMFNKPSWSDTDVYNIRLNLQNVLTQPMNIQRMKVQDYAIGNTADITDRIMAEGKDFTYSIDNYNTIINSSPDLKTLCKQKGLNIVHVDISDMGLDFDEKFLNYNEKGNKFVSWEDVLLNIDTPNIADEAERYEFRPDIITSENNKSDLLLKIGSGIKTLAFCGDNSSFTETVILSGDDLDTVEFTAGYSLLNFDVSQVNPDNLNIILKNNTEISGDNNEIRFNIDEDTFKLGNKNVSMDVGDNNVVNFTNKTKNRTTVYNFKKYKQGKKSTTIVGAGVKLIM